MAAKALERANESRELRAKGSQHHCGRGKKWAGGPSLSRKRKKPETRAEPRDEETKVRQRCCKDALKKGPESKKPEGLERGRGEMIVGKERTVGLAMDLK